MENQNSSILRQGYNRVNLVGYLKRLTLNDIQDSNGHPAISGTVTVHIPPASDHEVSVYTSKYTSDGKGGWNENKDYAGIQTVKNEYVSIAKLMEEGKEYAEAFACCTRVSVNGSLSRNEYNGQSGFTSRDNVRGRYFNRLDGDITPKATFEIECYIDKITDETRDGEDTGRKVVDVWVPMYRGAVLPQRLIVGTDLAAEFETIYERGQTVRLNGDLVNTINTVTTAAAGFGRKMETSTRVHELVIMGGLLPYDSEDNRSFAPEAITAAVNERNNVTIPGIMAKERKNTPTPVAAPVVPSAISAAASGFKY